MKFPVWSACLALAVLLAAGLVGCLPSGSSEADEEKESHFLAGKSCLNSMDYKGAIDAFEKSLKVNPDSAAAHFELACLFDQKESDPAAAIYHYQEYLKLRPNAGNADRARERISVCKQDLARTELPLPVAPAMQRQFEQLAEENKQLREELERWKAFYNRAQAPTNTTTSTGPRTGQAGPLTSNISSGPGSNFDSGARSAGTMRKHVVQANDTFSSIARKYNVKLDALTAANPGVDPRRLRPGQTVNVPPS